MMKERPLPTVADLPKLKAAQLQAIHRLLFGAEHPIANCQHLRRKIAWHLQAEKEGGLPEGVGARAIAIAREVPLRVRISENLSKRQPQIPPDQALTSTVLRTR